MYANDIRSAVMGSVNTRIFTQRAKTNKLMRIEQFEPVINNMYFLHRSLYRPGSDYDRFMKELERFNINGKNKHDDAADSLAMLAEMKRSTEMGPSAVMIPRKGRQRGRVG